MNCDKDKLLLFWSEELSDSEMESMRMHLAECAECQTEYLELTHLSAAFNSSPEEQAPRDFVGEAIKQTKANKVLLLEKFKKPSVLLPSMGGLFAVAAALMIGVYGPWTSHSEHQLRVETATTRSPLVSYTSYKKHMRSRVPAAMKLHFTGRQSLHSRAVKLKSKVRLAKRHLKTI